jgi:hypothetical protein
LVLAKLAASFLGKQKSGARIHELRFKVTAAGLSANDHAVFRLADREVGVLKRATDRVRRRCPRPLCRVYDFNIRRVAPRI